MVDREEIANHPVEQPPEVPDVAVFVQALEGRLVPHSFVEADQIIDGVKRLYTALQESRANGNSRALAVEEDTLDDLHAIAEKGRDYWLLSNDEEADLGAVMKAQSVDELPPKLESWLRNSIPEGESVKTGLWNLKKEARVRLHFNRLLHAQAGKADDQTARKQAVNEGVVPPESSPTAPQLRASVRDALVSGKGNRKPVNEPPHAAAPESKKENDDAELAPFAPVGGEERQAPQSDRSTEQDEPVSATGGDNPALFTIEKDADGTQRAVISEDVIQKGAADEPKSGEPKPAADDELHASPEGDKPRRKVSRRTLESIGGLAALQEVASLRNSRGVDHFYGFDAGGTMWHISRDKALEWYDNYDEDIPSADLPGDTSGEGADGAAELDWLGISQEGWDALSAADRGKLIKDRLAEDAAEAAKKQQADADKRAAALKAANAAAISSAVPNVQPPQPARRMVSPPPRPSRFGRVGEAFQYGITRVKESRFGEWVRERKGRVAAGIGIAALVGAGVVLYIHTKDSSGLHNAIEAIGPKGGGSSQDTVQQTVSVGGSSGHAAETSQQAASSGGATHTTGQTAPTSGTTGAASGHETSAGASATNSNLTDGPGGGASKVDKTATDPALIAGPGNGASEVSKGATDGGLIDPQLSGPTHGGNIPAGATNPGLTDPQLSGSGAGQSGTHNALDLSGPGAGAAEKLPHAVTLSLSHGGDNIWHEVTHYLTANGYTHNDVAVDTVKDAVLKHMHLSEAAATKLPVGYHFTIPRAVLEELLKAKK